MKLRNKCTGEIVEFRYLQSDHVAPLVLTTYENDKPEMYKYNSLAELNEEWEDYEEPKEYYCIDWTEPRAIYRTTYEDEGDDFNKEIGNYFETKEEAERAVEKLKAWKRLKDKGVRFGKRRHGHYGGEMFWECPNGTGVSDKQIWKDLDLLFGGEE